MHGKTRGRWTIVDSAVVVALAALVVYVYVGFYYADPRITESVRFPILLPVLLWTARIGALAIGGACVYLYWGIRTRRIAVSSAALLVASLFLCILAAYPVVSYLYERSFQADLQGYHPYLQLTPAPYQERPTPEGKRAFKIFCLGGSTTEFRDSKGKGWPSRVEEMLRGALPDGEIHVYNLGRQWYTSLHTLYNYETNLRRHKPDIILVMHAINDLLQNADFSYFSLGKFRDDYGHFPGPVYRLIKHPTMFEAVAEVGSLMWYAPRRKVVDTDIFPGLVPFRRNLTTLSDLARIRGTKVVLVTQPFLVKDSMTEAERGALTMLNREAVGPSQRWSIRTVKSGMEQYNDAVRQLATDTGTFLVDLEKVVPKTLEYLHDDVHYTDKAFDLISRYIAEKLTSFGVLR